MFCVKPIKRSIYGLSNDLPTPKPFHDRDHTLAFIVRYDAAQAMRCPISMAGFPPTSPHPPPTRPKVPSIAASSTSIRR